MNECNVIPDGLAIASCEMHFGQQAALPASLRWVQQKCMAEGRINYQVFGRPKAVHTTRKFSTNLTRWSSRFLFVARCMVRCFDDDCFFLLYRPYITFTRVDEIVVFTGKESVMMYVSKFHFMFLAVPCCFFFCCKIKANIEVRKQYWVFKFKSALLVTS